MISLAHVSLAPQVSQGVDAAQDCRAMSHLGSQILSGTMWNVYSMGIVCC